MFHLNVQLALDNIDSMTIQLKKAAKSKWEDENNNKIFYSYWFRGEYV